MGGVWWFEREREERERGFLLFSGLFNTHAFYIFHAQCVCVIFCALFVLSFFLIYSLFRLLVGFVYSLELRFSEIFFFFFFFFSLFICFHYLFLSSVSTVLLRALRLSNSDPMPDVVMRPFLV